MTKDTPLIVGLVMLLHHNSIEADEHSPALRLSGGGEERGA
jgi:hypothetical protein